MRTGRPRQFEITLSEAERAQLEALANSRAVAPWPGAAREDGAAVGRRGDEYDDRLSRLG